MSENTIAIPGLPVEFAGNADMAPPLPVDGARREKIVKILTDNGLPSTAVNVEAFALLQGLGLDAPAIVAILKTGASAVEVGARLAAGEKLEDVLGAKPKAPAPPPPPSPASFSLFNLDTETLVLVGAVVAVVLVLALKD